MTLKTQRLILRGWRDEDVQPFAAMNADKQVMEYFPNTLSPDDSRVLKEYFENHIQEHGFGFWAVEVPGVTDFAGMLGISIPRFEAHFAPCVEIGWRLAAQYWGKGYATEGAKAALQFGFERFDEIVSFTVPANIRSRRVMEKLGMTRDPDEDFLHPSLPAGHPLKPHVLYRLKRHDWTPPE